MSQSLLDAMLVNTRPEEVLSGARLPNGLIVIAVNKEDRKTITTGACKGLPAQHAELRRTGRPVRPVLNPGPDQGLLLFRVKRRIQEAFSAVIDAGAVCIVFQ